MQALACKHNLGHSGAADLAVVLTAVANNRVEGPRQANGANDCMACLVCLPFYLVYQPVNFTMEGPGPRAYRARACIAHEGDHQAGCVLHLGMQLVNRLAVFSRGGIG